MGRNREPIALIQAKGRSNLSKATIEERAQSEVQVLLTAVEPPSYLPTQLQDKFKEIAAKLLQVGIFTELDEDMLARYLLAEANYLRLTSMLNKSINEGKVDEIAKLTRSQNAAFNQCHSCASALGLSITSRCKLIVPKVEEAPPENRFAKFAKGAGA